MSGGPVPPPGVVSGVAALRQAFADLHVMHECDQQCPPDCGASDYSPAAYRHHDEHNADVREVIQERAEWLVDALDEWLGLGTGGEGAAAAVAGNIAVSGAVVGESRDAPARLVPLRIVRDHDLYRQWWESLPDRADVVDTLAELKNPDPDAEWILHQLMLLVFQRDDAITVPWLRVHGLVPEAHVHWLSLDIDPSYDGLGVLDGVDVVVNVQTSGQRHQWLSVSSYVSHPSQVFVPEQSEPGAALAEVIDAALALANAEITERDNFADAARIAVPNVPRGETHPESGDKESQR